MEILNLNKVSKKFKSFFLDNVSLTLNDKDIIGFVGENGAGKSTTFKLIGGLLNVDSGDIKIFNKSLDELGDERENVAFVLDELCFPMSFKVYQLAKVLKNTFSNWEDDKFDRYLVRFNIDKKKKIKELSKGMKAKLNLAIAFSHRANLLMLDEPMNGLDPVARDEVVEEIFNYTNDKENSATIISSHIISDLEKLCNRIVLIHEGKIIIDERKDILLNAFDVITINKEAFESMDKDKIIRFRTLDNLSFDILVKRNEVDNVAVKQATLEDIVLFMIRGKTI